MVRKVEKVVWVAYNGVEFTSCEEAERYEMKLRIMGQIEKEEAQFEDRFDVSDAVDFILENYNLTIKGARQCSLVR